MRKLVGVATLVALCAIYLVNASWLAPQPLQERSYLAHRGVHQNFDRTALAHGDCTATRISTPTHSFIENTIPSIRAAFEYGADVVEIDIHPTTDGGFAVFHDWNVDCRTDGSGETRSFSLAELKRLDAGFGYTADNGASYPLRGRGVGLIPSLSEVLKEFRDRRFLLHIKSDDPREGDLLADFLLTLPEANPARLSAYGGERPIARLSARLPSLVVLTKRSMKECGAAYIAAGWTGFVPTNCRHTILIAPSNYVRLFWGWPNRFQQRMRAVGTEVMIIGAHKKGEAIGGINSVEAHRRIPRSWKGGIWTDRIEIINPDTAQ